MVLKANTHARSAAARRPGPAALCRTGDLAAPWITISVSGKYDVQ